jgi:hypoxanthine-DNA glycosylase
MGELFGAGRDLAYARRCRRLTAAGVAVWDVLHQAARRGSLDADIDATSLVPNDFAAFFRAHPGIRTVAFNGQTAGTLFRRRVLPQLGALAPPRLLVLPSTSPAHAGRSRAQKLAAWSSILGAVNRGG